MKRQDYPKKRFPPQALLIRRLVYFISTFLAILINGDVLRAQVDPTMLLVDWDQNPHWANTFDEPLFFNSGDMKGNGPGIKMFRWDSLGVVKLNRNDPDPQSYFGYRYLSMDIESSAPLPGGMEDLAIVGAFKLGENEGGWDITFNGGMGTSNDGHYSNSDALYGVAAINASRPIDEDSRIHIGISYQGNRVLFPDIPIPYAMYEHKLNEQFRYRVGIPNSAIEWKPGENVTVSLNYDYPMNVRSSITFKLNDSWSLMGEYVHSIDGVFLDGQNNTRFFHQFQRFDAGVRWKSKWIDITIGVGYAFDQRFETGYDIRHTSNAGRPSDEMFLMLVLQGIF